MNKILKYITYSIFALALVSCSFSELDSMETGDGQYIEFIARPTGYDISITETKALTGDELSDLESKIYSLYFIVFDSNGDRIEELDAALNPSTELSKTLYYDHGGEITVCYLANVSAEYAASLQTISDLSTKPIVITEYDTFEDTGYIGVPIINVGTAEEPNEKRCLPMFGMYELKLADNGMISGSVTSNNVTQVTIPLERLFAKVNLNIKMALDASSILGSLTGVNPYFRLQHFSVNNIPNKVLLAKTVGDKNGTVIDDSYSRSENQTFSTFDISLGTPQYIYDNSVLDTSLGGLIGEVKVKEYNITCYVPEYALLPKDGTANTNTDESKKPEQLNGGTPVYIAFEGIINHPDYNDAVCDYNVYLGSNKTNNFSLCRNVHYKNTLTIYGINNAILETDSRVNYNGTNLADVNNTGTETPANCYIISKPGRYLIPTYRGATTTGGTMNGNVDANSVISLNEKIEDNNPANTISNLSVVDINGKKYIQFDVNISTSNGAVSHNDVNHGNKLLVLKKNNTIAWSWHLWFCKNDSRADNQHHSYVKGDNTYTVMNRALGSINADDIENVLGYSIAYWTDGLYYQYGRKDPFLLGSDNSVTASELTANYDNSIKDPQGFMSGWTANMGGWTTNENTKSENDPCPPGYRVPSTSIWTTDNEPNATMVSTMNTLGINGFPYNLQVTLDMNKNIAYPYSYSIVDSQLYDDIYEPITNGTEEVSIIDIAGTGIDMLIKYSGGRSYKVGYIWAKDGRIEYDLNDLNIDDGSQVFMKYKINLGFLGTPEGWLPNDPNKSEDGYTIGNFHNTFIKNVPSLVRSAVERALKNANINLDDMARNIINNLKEQEYNVSIQNLSDIDIADGAHVRCIVD